MDYKEKYEMALEGIQEILGSGEDSIKMSRLQLRLQGIFPELKELENERIREKVIATIHLYYGEPLEDEAKEMIAWLEKQGEHANFRNKIQVGDKVTRNKDGVLVNLSQLNRVAKKQGEQKPAIEMKSAEESLGIDSDTYNKIVNECIYGEQKPAWSEEDENAIQVLKDIVKHSNEINENIYTIPLKEKLYDWLKSLKDRVQPQPKQEWNEEEKARIDKIVDVLDWAEEKGYIRYSDWEDYVCYVKSLRPQTTWKPSDEMLEALYRVIPENVMEKSEDKMLLDKLYQGLKYGKVLSEK